MSQWSNERVCLVCGGGMAGRRGDAIYCSRKCSNASRTTSVARPHTEPGTKRCTACGIVKLLDEFSPRTDRRTTLKAHCDECVAEQARAWRERNREKVRQQARARYLRNSETIKARAAVYKRENREKARAHSAVEYALETGRMVRPDVCERCQQVGVIHAHHADYTRKLDVEWLCSPCHKREHVALRREEIAA